MVTNVFSTKQNKRNQNMILCKTIILFPLSLGTCIKHFPYSKKPPFPIFKSFRNSSSNLSTCSLKPDTHFETLTPHQKHQLNLYMSSLNQWNQKMNLTGAKDENEIMERHIEDSLALIEPIRSSYLEHCGDSWENLRIVDVGTGAGLPGIILAIACPGWRVTLLESINKRCVFMEHVAGVTGLLNVQVVRDRAESLGHHTEYREVFDVAVARAVSDMRILAEYCLPLVRVGGIFVAAKGHNPQEEVRQAKKAISLMGASWLQTHPVKSFSKYGQRTAVVCLKDCPTPRKYPRDPGTPAKAPL